MPPPSATTRSIDRSEIVSMVEEPVQAGEGDVSIDALEYVERPRDRLIIGRMQSPGPPVLRKDAHHVLEFALHLRRHVGTRLAEILEVGCREHQHLTGTVMAEVVVALLVFGSARPVQEVCLLALRLLGE